MLCGCERDSGLVFLSMIRFTQGNLLEARVDALVNAVNTVGVMGKGIALMFKEKYPENFKAYEAACKTDAIQVGKMFVTPGVELGGPKWIVNFPEEALAPANEAGMGR